MADERIPNFREFYPYYLGEHRHPLCRILHFIGTTLLFVIVGTAAVTQNPWLLIALPFTGYGFAWVGHFFIEKNRPATFTYPWWSLLGDFKMWTEMVRGQHWTGDTVAPQT